jgi:hypothetical protein
VTEVNSTTKLKYGTTSSYGSTKDIATAYTAHASYLSALLPGTLYHLAACSTSILETCSADQTFTTLPAISTPTQLPLPPASEVDVALRLVTGSTLTVTGCSDIQTKLNAVAALDGNLTHEVIIPASLTCEGQWTLRARTGTNPNGSGYINIHSDSAALPPPGVRVITTDAAAMPTLIANRVLASITGVPGPPSSCYYLGDLAIDDVSATPVLYKCVPGGPLVTIEGQAASYSVITLAGSGTSTPSTCTNGDFFRRTDIANVDNQYFWCVSDNNYRQVYFVCGGFQNFPALQTEAAAQNYHLYGIRISSLPMPTNYVANFYQSGRSLGSTNFCHVQTVVGNSNIVFDRMYFDGLGYPMRTQYSFCFWDGVNMAIVNSFFNEINITVLSNTSELSANAIFMLQGPGPLKIENNYFKNALGLPIFCADDLGGSVTNQPSDMVLRRNYFFEDNAYNNDSASSNGRYYYRRNFVELKRGQRWLIEGNIFDGGWSGPTSGAALSFTARAGGYPYLTNVMSDRDVIIRNNWFKNNPVVMGMTGFNDVYNIQPLQGQHYLVQNNLITDAGVSSDGTRTGWPNHSVFQGTVNLIQLGLQDLTQVGNTIFNAYGDLMKAYQYPFPNTAIQLDDNVYYANAISYAGGIAGDAINGGTAALNQMWQAGAGYAWKADNNVIVQNNISSAYPASTQFVNCADGPSCSAAIGLDSNYHLLRTSSYKGTAYAGGDPGFNWSVYDPVIGKVNRLRVVGIGTTTLSVEYQAPDLFACTVITGSISVQDSGGSRDRVVVVPGLSPSTSYTLTVLCAVQRATVSGTTLATSGGTSNTVLTLAPAANRGIATAGVSYGATPALGSTVSPVSCAITCTLTVPSTKGVPVYYQVKYFNGSSAQVSIGRVETATPQ